MVKCVASMLSVGITVSIRCDHWFQKRRNSLEIVNERTRIQRKLPQSPLESVKFLISSSRPACSNALDHALSGEHFKRIYRCVQRKVKRKKKEEDECQKPENKNRERKEGRGGRSM
ncbi:hypothetical protein CEXT_519231 [Caerostris extrusa]|uniref:Uncharacterized protein n=1 Tax=Caerostris extrusa TaxID=172846 RepID=A0AAV4RIM2_CAEEX|nr:hypothetical protein CEXT_519231 [Caerostris extrusa]